LSDMERYLGGGQRVLFVGEGDFGFSACISKILPSADGRELKATTWDSKTKLESSFANASANTRMITENGGSVLYGVDATKLDEHFTPSTFDSVVWMFPHVPGKQNIKRNRALLQAFFSSSRKVLAPGGTVVLALAEGQSGLGNLTSNQDWLHSWKLSAAAAEGGMLVSSRADLELSEFHNLGYSPQGHRGSGGTFPTRQAEIFRLVAPDSERNKVAVQAPCYVHELHLLDSKMHAASALESAAEMAVIALLAEKGLPTSSLWSTLLVDFYVCPRTQLLSHTLQLAYCSETHALGRSAADAIRELVESELPARLGLSLRTEKAGGKVSKEHCWAVAQELRRLSLAGEQEQGQRETAVQQSADTAERLNEALRALEDDGAQEQQIGTESSGAEVEEIKSIARGLWRRRVGVLINEARIFSHHA